MHNLSVIDATKCIFVVKITENYDAIMFITQYVYFNSCAADDLKLSHRRARVTSSQPHMISDTGHCKKSATVMFLRKSYCEKLPPPRQPRKMIASFSLTP